MKKVLGIHSQLVTQKGFSLIELLVVMGILGIVMVGLFVGLDPIGQFQKTNDANRKSDLSSIQKALEFYYQDNGEYPASSGDFKIVNGSVTLNWGSSWQPYMNSLPSDPTGTKNYVYYSPAGSNGQTYYIYASLERGENDPDTCNEGSACSTLLNGGGFPSAQACGETCNYGVSSPNVSP